MQPWKWVNPSALFFGQHAQMLAVGDDGTVWVGFERHQPCACPMRQKEMNLTLACQHRSCTATGSGRSTVCGSRPTRARAAGTSGPGKWGRKVLRSEYLIFAREIDAIAPTGTVGSQNSAEIEVRQKRPRSTGNRYLGRGRDPDQDNTNHDETDSDEHPSAQVVIPNDARRDDDEHDADRRPEAVGHANVQPRTQREPEKRECG